MLGVMVFAHGSRDPLWRAPVEAVSRRIARARPAGPGVRAPTWSCASPTCPPRSPTWWPAGATSVRVLPLFFGMGKHAREDLPEIMKDLATRHPGVRLEQLPAAGEDPRLTALLAQIALEPIP